MTQRSDRYQLIESRLDRPLVDFVAERRRVDGPPFRPAASWRAIAVEIEQITGITVNPESLRLWFADRQPEPAGGAR